MENQLTNSRSERVLAGVCGGIAEQTGLDPALVRIAFVAAAVLFDLPAAVIIYMVLAFALPEEDAVGGPGKIKMDQRGKRTLDRPVGDGRDDTRAAAGAVRSTTGVAARGLSSVVVVAGNVGLVVAEAALAAASAAVGAALSAYADPRSASPRPEGRPNDWEVKGDPVSGRIAAGGGAQRLRMEPAVAQMTANAAQSEPARERVSVPTRTSVPVRDLGGDSRGADSRVEDSRVEDSRGGDSRGGANSADGGRSEAESRDAAHDPWLSDEERLEFDVKRRVDTELGNARAILERTAPTAKPSRSPNLKTKRGGFTHKLFGLVLAGGGAAMFIQTVQPGTLDGIMTSVPMAAFGAVAVVWAGLFVFFSSLRRKSRGGAGHRG